MISCTLPYIIEGFIVAHWHKCSMYFAGICTSMAHVCHPSGHWLIPQFNPASSPFRHSVSCSNCISRMIFFFQFSDISFIFPLLLYAFPIPLCLFRQIISHFLQFFTFRSIHLFYFYVYAYFINNYWLFYFFAFQKLSSFQVSPSNPHSKSPPFWFYEGVCPPMHPLPPYCSKFS